MSEFWMPHGHCFFWEPSILWLHVISDIIIGLSYYSIPFALAYFLKRRVDMIHSWLIWLFALFISACGTGHFIAAFTMWQPYYELEGYIKAFTAFVSLVTAISIWPLLPKLFLLPSPSQLHRVKRENLKLKKENEDLKNDR